MDHQQIGADPTLTTQTHIETQAECPGTAESGSAPGFRTCSSGRRRRRRRKWIRLAILWSVFLLAAAALIFIIVAIVFTALERKAARDQYTAMQTMYETVEDEEYAQDDATAASTPAPTIDPNLWYAGKADIADKRIDFPALQARNADVCGWITVEDTTIDYPVLRAEGSDVLYLSHDIDGNVSEHGTICLDVKCARDFSDRVTLVYGHNMKDGSMFAPLYRYYTDAEFFNADHKITIYIDNAALHYRVFSACEFSYAHPLFFYDMTNDGDFMAYIDSFLGNRDLKARIRQVTVKPDDHILTLITSTNARADQRLFVQAVLVDDE